MRRCTVAALAFTILLAVGMVEAFLCISQGAIGLRRTLPQQQRVKPRLRYSTVKIAGRGDTMCGDALCRGGSRNRASWWKQRGRRTRLEPLGTTAESMSSPVTAQGNSTVSAKVSLTTGDQEISVAGSMKGTGPSDDGGSSSGEVGARRRQSLLKTLWQFSRPHTMIGTAIAIPAMGAFAAPPGIFPGRQFILATLWAIVPSLLINVYITGLNQITDVEIDGVNKPNLPIPAGNLSPKGAKLTVTLCLIAGMVLGLIPSSLGSPGLSLTVLLSVIIGTAYSLPPMRLKRFPQLAALCVLVVRGSIINGGFYAHAQAAAYGLATKRTAWEALSFPLRDARCAFALAYFTVFAVVIALMKDVPDVAGDRKFNIPSFSVVLGEERLFAFARRLLTTLLWSTAIALGFGAREAFAGGLKRIAVSRVFVALAALGCGQKVRTRAREVDPKRPDHVSAFYMFLWKIFYVSYVFLPLAR